MKYFNITLFILLSLYRMEAVTAAVSDTLIPPTDTPHLVDKAVIDSSGDVDATVTIEDPSEEEEPVDIIDTALEESPEQWPPENKKMPVSPATEGSNYNNSSVATTNWDPESSNTYKVTWTDALITAPLFGWTMYNFTRVYEQEGSSVEEIKALDKNDINSIDRWIAGKNDESAEVISDYIFYGSIPIPFIISLIDGEQREEFWTVNLLYIESLSITGALYTSAGVYVDRYRPNVYDESVPPEEKTSGNRRNSFFGGHAALVGTTTFFAAKVLHDMHPDSPSWIYFTLAGAATGSTAWLRIQAGKHFLTDTILGVAVGTASGILVPHFHKTSPSERKWSLITDSVRGNQTIGIQYTF